MFEGGEQRKYQMLVTDIPELYEAYDRLCLSPHICSRTGMPHASFRPVVEKGRVVHFPTGDAAEYPRGVCEAHAEALLRWFIRRGHGTSRFSFLEIFSCNA